MDIEIFKNGSRILHRSQDMIRTQRANKPGRYPTTWFLDGQFSSTLAVPITPDSVLKSNIQNTIKSVRGPDGGFTKVSEESGMKVSRMFPKSPTPDQCPYDRKCLADANVNCLAPGVVYHAKCTDCPDKPNLYIGQSGQSIHARSLGHSAKIKGKDKSNSLYKHNLQHHSETHTQSDRFKFTIDSRHQDNMSRLLTEARDIHCHPDPLLNGKNEYGTAKFITLEPRRIYT